MSFNRNSDYRRNKNTADIVYAFANGEEQRFRKTEDGRILLIHTDKHGDVTTRKVPNSEMTGAQVDELKKFSDEDYHLTDKKDVREAKHCVPLEGHEDEIADYEDSVEDIYMRAYEEENGESDPRTIENVMAILDECLDGRHKEWFILFHRDRLSARVIALKYQVAHTTVSRALMVMDKKLRKMFWVSKKICSKTL